MASFENEIIQIEGDSPSPDLVGVPTATLQARISSDLSELAMPEISGFSGSEASIHLASLSLPEAPQGASLVGDSMEQHSMSARAAASAGGHAVRSQNAASLFSSLANSPSAMNVLKWLGPAGVVGGSVAEFVKDPSVRGLVKAGVGMAIGFGTIAAVGALGLASASFGTAIVAGAGLAVGGIALWKGSMSLVDRLFG